MDVASTKFIMHTHLALLGRRAFVPPNTNELQITRFTSWLRMESLEVRVWGFGLEVSGVEFGVSGSRFRVSDLGFGVWGGEFRGLGFWFRVQS